MENNKLIKLFKESLNTGFIDKTNDSSHLYRPQLLVNRKIPREKVLSTIINELENCHEFYFTVAFVTTSGLASLYNTLIDLKDKGIKGKVVVSQYLNFTDPLALERLLKFDNIELRISTKGNTHSKGYIFKHENYYNIIIGSSNWTANALSENKEWNLKISSLDNSEITNSILSEFERNFEHAEIVNEKYLTKYKEVYENQRLKRKKSNILLSNDIDYSPNSMQVEALNNLNDLRENNKNKALIISATGTGKTFLSAFDVQNYKAKKILFIVHRLIIAQKALETFQAVLKNSYSYGLYSGNLKEKDVDFLFTTIQTISKDDHLSNFEKDDFDYIIVDETHRAGAETYKKVLNYFTPNFLLGMTATPERTDGLDIFELFDHNIAYEIRLHRAMEENMLCPFHYFGISELLVDGNIVDDTKDFAKINLVDKGNKIIENAKFYGSDSRITRGLAFCSKKSEAIDLAKLFSEQGLPSIALTGDNSDTERTAAIRRLESDNIKEKIDYIFTVDIFNEGIDIPKVNQILMIRPTESAIIFIQQLGRGLRKTDDKDYLTVIDFIGNHKNNYLIPIALYGDTSYNKDSLRKLISEGSKELPGSSTINFDRISKEQIFKSIDVSNMKTLNDLKKDYQLLKFRLGRIPMMVDFIENNSRDPFLYVQYAKSYYNFVRKVEKGVINELSHLSVRLLQIFSTEINNSKRVEESLVLKYLIKKGRITHDSISKITLENYGYQVSKGSFQSCLNNINLEFIRDKFNKKLLPLKEILNIEILNHDKGFVEFSSTFKEILKDETFKLFFKDTIDFSIRRFDNFFDQEKWQNGFILYRKYSRKDVFRILNVDVNPVAQNVGGYMVVNEGKDCPIFVNYKKEEDISNSTKYEDRFLNPGEFEWMSKNKRKLTSKDVQSIIGEYGPINLPLFIKKNNDEGLEFYYMGLVIPQNEKIVETKISNDKGQLLPVVKMCFTLNTPVESNLYNYFDEESKEKSRILEGESKESSFKIPLFDFYAAAGSFSEMQSSMDYELIPCDEKYSTDEYFACKIVGESMNKTIPNNSIAIFKKYTNGSRNGKIVLVEHRDIQDNDFNSQFTVKKYESEKSFNEEGWVHRQILLKPNSYDSSYEDIIITEENADGMKVIGEFIKVL
jgi:superfamily II DNA or RNA helicase/SOS-response transcriptional repressor LexA